MFLLSLRQDHFSNLTVKILGPTRPFLELKKCYISTQIHKKRPSESPAVAHFRDRYPPAYKNYVSTLPKGKSFQ